MSGDPARPSPGAYCAWILGALGFLYAWFHRVTPSVMVDRLMADFSIGGTVLGTLSSLYFYAYASIQIPVGVIIDRWGARIPFALALLLATAGSALFAAATDIATAYLGRILIGVGAAFAWVSVLKISSLHFPPRRFAMLSGAGMFVGLIGGLTGQVVAGAMVDVIGWRGTMWVAAAAGGLLALAVFLFVRDSPSRDENRSTGGSMAVVMAGLGTALRQPQVWLVAGGGAIAAAPIFIFASLWGVPYLMQVYDLPRTVAASMTAAMLMGWGAGAFVGGWISDRIRNRRLPLLCGVTTAALALSIALYLPELPIAAVGALMLVAGFGSGTVVLTYAISGDLSPSQARGAAYGFANMLIIASGAVFQMLAGWLLDLNWTGTMVNGARAYAPQTYATAFLLIPATYIAGLLLIATARNPKTKPVEDETP